MIATNPLEIIVIGAGLIGPRHAEHVKKHPVAHLFGIIDPNPAAAEIASNLDTDYFPSISDLVQFCKTNELNLPDGAIVCTPNHTHVVISAELASYGIHLLVEKPLSSTPEQLAAIRDYAESKNVKLLVGHHRRFNPFIVETKKNIDKVGQLIALQGSWALKKPEDYFIKGLWRTDAKTGGGSLLINLVHDVDVLQYLIGPIERVYAEVLDKQRDHYPNADEGAVLTLRFKNGCCGTFICSDNVTSPFNFESGTGENPLIPFHDQLEGVYRIFGSKGTLSVPDLNLYHQPLEKEPSWNCPVERTPLVDNRFETLFSNMPFDLQLDHFVDVIRGKQEPSCSANDGMAALLCIEAIIKSIDTGLPQLVKQVDDIKPDFSCLGLEKLKSGSA